jgi:hypothetical protein
MKYKAAVYYPELISWLVLYNQNTFGATSKEDI